MGSNLFVRNAGVSLDFGNGGYRFNSFGYERDQGTGVTMNHTREICAGCGKCLDLNRVLYDEMKNKLCFQCFRCLYGRKDEQE